MSGGRGELSDEKGPLQPTNETGIYLHQHEHSWLQVGAKGWPSGSWHPVFKCSICGDVICDLHVEVDVLGHVTRPGTSDGGA